MDALKRKAKMGVLKDLHSEAKKMLKDDGMDPAPGGLAQKVSVVAKDKKGLKERLDKAESMLDADPELKAHDMSDEQEPDGDLLSEVEEDPKTEHTSGDAADEIEKLSDSLTGMDPDKLDKLISKLQSMRSK